MGKGRQQYTHPLGPLKRDLPEVFLRLCHYCLYLNESDREIEQCERCEKCFGPRPINHSYSFKDSDSETEFDPSLEQALDSLEEELDQNSDETHLKDNPNKKVSRKSLVNGLNVKW